MKYVLIMVLWSTAQGGAPATAEFNSKEACDYSVGYLKQKLQNQPAYWLIMCFPKGSSSD